VLCDDGDASAVALLQGAPSHHEEEEKEEEEEEKEEEEEEGPEEGSVSVVKMIGYDGNITERALGEADGQPDTVWSLQTHWALTVSMQDPRSH